MTRKKDSKDTKELSRLFADKLKHARIRSGLSQNELSHKSKISIDTIRSLECGRITSPSIFTSYTLVRCLGGNLGRWLKEINDSSNAD